MAIFADSALDHDGFNYAFVAIDVVTKICHAVPIKDKRPEESVRAMKGVLHVIGIPKVLYHDNEGSWNITQLIQLVNSHKLKLSITSSPPPFVEGMVQTLKRMIHTRLEGLELDKEEWVDLLPSVLKKYNNQKHSTTDMSPNMAKMKDNHIEVWLNVHNKSLFERRYPPLKIGVRIRVNTTSNNFKQTYVSS